MRRMSFSISAARHRLNGSATAALLRNSGTTAAAAHLARALLFTLKDRLFLQCRGYIMEADLNKFRYSEKNIETLRSQGSECGELREDEMLPEFCLASGGTEKKARFALGHRCFVLRLFGKIVCSAWIGLGEIRYRGPSIFLYSDSTSFFLQHNQAWIYDVSCDPKHWGKGLASALIHEILGTLKETGVHRVTGTVGLENGASIKAHARNSFRLLEKVYFVRFLFIKIRKKKGLPWDYTEEWCRKNSRPMEKTMVVHLIPSLGIGGAERVVMDAFYGIDRSRFSAKIIYWENRTDLLAGNAFREDDIIRLPVKRVISLTTVRRLYRLLKELHTNVLRTHLIDADLLGFIVTRFLPVRHVITIHSYPFPIKITHRIRYKIMSLVSDRIVCVSETVKKHVMVHAGVSEKKISVVRNGIDLKKFSSFLTDNQKAILRKELSISPGSRIVGTVSRLIEDKGHRYLLMAIPEIALRYPAFQCLIIGDGELRNSLVEQSRSLGIADRVIFTGSRSNIPGFLDIMDVFVLPSFREALGICVLEAMAMGKPIVACNDAAVPELIENGKEGILVRPGDHGAIAEAVSQLLLNPELSKRLAESAKKKVALFTVESMVLEMQAIYREITKHDRIARSGY
jgi:glycosyltransferase involved in cell wall biosynthesis/RimJ/RimL family protein N-acetyltransferase